MPLVNWTVKPAKALLRSTIKAIRLEKERLPENLIGLLLLYIISAIYQQHKFKSLNTCTFWTAGKVINLKILKKLELIFRVRNTIS